MIKNNKTKKNRIGFRNISNTSSEVLKFIFSVQQAFKSQQSHVSFYKKANGRFSSIYFPNISFEFKNCKFKSLHGVVFLIYDEITKTTVTSKFVKRVLEFNSVDNNLILPFSLNDLSTELGFNKSPVIPEDKVYSKYLQVKFKFGGEELQFKFLCLEKEGKIKLSFYTKKSERKLLKNFSRLDRELMKFRIRSNYKRNWHKSLDLKDCRFCNF